MEVLKLNPLEKQNAICFILKRTDQGYNPRDFKQFKKFVTESNINLITFDVNNDNTEHFRVCKLYTQVKNLSLPQYCLDVPEYAKGYLMEEIFEKEELLTELQDEYEELDDKKSFKAQNLLSWVEILKDEIQEKIDFYKYDLRPQWITKKILDLLRNIEQKETKLVHFSQKDVLSDIIDLLKEMKVNVKIVDEKSKFNYTNINYKQEEVKQW